MTRHPSPVDSSPASRPMTDPVKLTPLACPCCRSTNTGPQVEPFPSGKPTIAELEKILSSPDDKYKINIRPDGSIDTYILSQCGDCGCVWDEARRAGRTECVVKGERPAHGGRPMTLRECMDAEDPPERQDDAVLREAVIGALERAKQIVVKGEPCVLLSSADDARIRAALASSTNRETKP